MSHRWLWTVIAVAAAGCLALTVDRNSATVGNNADEQIAHPSELPLLRFTEALLRGNEFRPEKASRVVTSLSTARDLKTLCWCDQERVLLASAWPSERDYESIRFTLLMPGALRVSGTWPATLFFSKQWRCLVRAQGTCWLAICQRDSERVERAVRFDLDHCTSTLVEAPPPLTDIPLWIRFGKPAGFESLVHKGPLNLFDGGGRLLATAPLPEGIFPVWQRATAVRSTADGYEVLARAVTSLEFARHDDPPSEAVLLAIPPGRSGACAILKRFRAPEVALPDFVDANTWVCHGLDWPVMSQDGSRIAFRENLRLDMPREQMQVLRLWCWDRARDTMVLMDTVGAYLSPGHSYRLVVSGGSDEVDEQYWKYSAWADFAELMPALSPTGDKIAYRSGDELVIAEVPSR